MYCFMGDVTPLVFCVQSHLGPYQAHLILTYLALYLVPTLVAVCRNDTAKFTGSWVMSLLELGLY